MFLQGRPQHGLQLGHATLKWSDGDARIFDTNDDALQLVFAVVDVWKTSAEN